MDEIILKGLLYRRAAVLQDIWRGAGVVTRLREDLVHLEAVILMIDPEHKFDDSVIEDEIFEEELHSDLFPIENLDLLPRTRFH
ncbi:hypothetical protein [Sphingomonas sp. C3-2]|uniref:hypothetical protein n=1 Tax=Sphingomonas sp. C3-2 TaxID=3062169 RepID=UPI00294A9F34|nr:hypothetical protein [Sphingomonas sp. C3-2]WOK36083.1 hypothetical protein QYC26_13885 [Sphingomonas sp. C3-2]